MRAMRTNALLFAAALCAAAASAAQAAKVVVTGDRVNLRAAAQGESEVVAQLSFGEELELHGSPTRGSPSPSPNGATSGSPRRS